MLNELQPDMRKLIDLVPKIENFDATIAAARTTGESITPTRRALDERSRMEQEAVHLRTKWAI